MRSSGPGARIVIIGATRGAADDFAREMAGAQRATFGLQRFSLTQYAARRALLALAASHLAPGTALGAEAVATRAAFDAVQSASLEYFAPVAASPGFPRALARTLQELRLNGIGAAALAGSAPAGVDLAALLERFDACFVDAASTDRAALFRTATDAVRVGAERFDLAVLLDVPVDGAAERAFVQAVAASAAAVVATVPRGDHDTIAQLEAIDGAVEELEDRARPDDLFALRRYLFAAAEEPPERELDGSLDLFSAPGEGRECVEIARRILKEARRGVRFDEIAILIRAPHSYFGLLEHALKRADVAAWFDRGTRRPHPAGRAFLALIACASEQLSAARFAEYLSLAQVPDLPDASGPASPRREAAWVRSEDDALALPAAAADSGDTHDEGSDRDDSGAAVAPGTADEAVIAGSLRAPWRWEALLVEAAVIGRDATRWRARLAGKARELDRQLREASRDEGDDGAKVQALERTSEQLRHLQAFALPIVDELSTWPSAATWGVWLDLFTRLAPRVLREPAGVLRILAELRPMASVGPIALDEAQRVLADRLLMLPADPPARRFGRVFVGTPQQARGRTFRVVFVPGLAERLFPQKPREDPLLLDSAREALDPALRTQGHRLAAERLLLQIAAGAATERLYVSYPRIELTESRARVPSFYALDLMRAATGRIPDYEWLEERARAAGDAMLAWPAPGEPDDAIDELEHDLSVLRKLLDDPDRERVKGQAHYLLKLNECLRRAVIDRWARAGAKWAINDGLIRVTGDTKAMLDSQRLTARPYSLSALQRFAACPYQFLLAAVYRLQPVEQPESLQRMDPLTRGSIFHDVQAKFFRALESRGALPVTEATVESATEVLDTVLDTVAAKAHDDFAPAVERVWADEIAAIRRDLHGWLWRLAHDGAEWLPERFEFAFGTVPGERDPASIRENVTIAGRYQMRGAVDLIESHRSSGVLRVTDHKTGRKPDGIERTVVGGGAVLQPVLYSAAVEAALDRPVAFGRLFYCTAAGGYYEHPIPLNEKTRAAGLEVLEVIDRAIEQGFLPAAPTADACRRCDFRPVCGPDVFRRVREKPENRLADLLALRSRP